MLLSSAEKEAQVVELYKQGKTIREIAKEVHMSFGDIGSVIKKATGDVKEEKEKKTIDTQALQLFLQDKKPIEVAIALDINADEVEELYKEFWRLQDLHKLTLVYEEIKHYLPEFLQLFRIIKENKMDNKKDIANALKYADRLPCLENEFQILVNQIETLENKKKASQNELFAIVNEISKTKNSIDAFQSNLDSKIKEIAEMDKKLAAVNKLIEDIQENEDYKKIERLAEEKVDSILTNKKAIILTAIISAVAALRNDPDKQVLIYDAAELPSMNAIISSSQNPESYLLLLLLLHPHHKRILELAEMYYDELLKFAAHNAIYSAIEKKDIIINKQKIC
jgi:chromosome segregation ATPase